jgi:anti-sigma factor RsiW
MKEDCLEIEPLLAPRADSQLDPARRAAVERHLAVCPACRHAAALQRDVRDLLVARADGLRIRASEDLRRRVTAQVGRRDRRSAWSPVRLPVAATLLLTVLVLGTYTLTSTSTTVLAAQLALDHLKCVKLVQDPSGQGLDPVAAGEEWERTYKGPLTVPTISAADGSRLVGVRRCLYGHGHLAHLLYNVNGRIVSLFVMPKADHEASAEGTLLAVFGHEARVWSAGDQTFALVSDADVVGMDRLEQTFRGE